MQSTHSARKKREGPFNGLPVLGAGLGYRGEIEEQIKANRGKIDFLELISDHYIDTNPFKDQELAELSQEFPIVLHGVAMSIGTAAPLEEDYLLKLAGIARKSKALWLSDHLCFTKAGGIDLGQLTPLPFTEEAIEIVCHNVKQVKRHVKAPFLLENITYYFPIPGAEMDEPEFITRVLKEADCGLLLDVTNLFTNATNHGYDPYEFLKSIPLDRVVQIHLAGGMWMQEVLIDSHSHAVPAEVWELLTWVVAHSAVKGVLVERDDNFPPFSELIGELDAARKIIQAWPQSRASV